MKTIKRTTAIIAIAFLTFSFTTLEDINKDVNIDKSKVTWKGYKVTGSHTGEITIKSGTLNFNNETLTGGNFIIDMTTISVTDLKGDYKTQLEGHLKSDDFFGVSDHPEAKLVFTDVKVSGKNAYEITGNITIKGKTETIAFDLSIYGNKATGSLKIDRTKFDVKYGSSSFFDNLKDKVIYDEFDIVVDLEF
ncbi:YceI family protein [Winogradskyella sp.]|uniref:YceI family protein n=1 Tax=Winogradskyella sp. TaxID=1883156 RepID=UPI002617527E|nr:YceI family protein [Winogradskyella sp.]